MNSSDLPPTSQSDLVKNDPILADLPSQAVPPGLSSTVRLTPFWRMSLFALGLFLIAGFGLAISLEPSARGFGTHQQLGLPPCSIQFIFGVPCPSCGMTTSFAHYVRGQIGMSWQANPAGLYLAILCTLLIPWALLSGYQGQLLGIANFEKSAALAMSPLIVIAIADWAVRLWWLSA